MFNEKNIPKLISTIPPIGIILATVFLTFLIVRSEYKSLEFETKQMRQTFIKEKKISLKTEVEEVVNYIRYIDAINIQEKKHNTSLKKDITDFIQNVLSKTNGYIYIIDDKANIVYHPSIKQNTNTWNLQDKTGLYIAQEAISQAKQHPQGAYINYQWKDSKQTKEKKKTTYVYYLKELKWVIATGSYMDEVEKEISQKVIYGQVLLNENISYTLLVSLVLTIITLIISFIFSNTINKIFINYKRAVIKKEKKLRKLNRHLKKLANEEIKKRSLKEKELEVIHQERLTGLPNRLKLSEILEVEKNPKLAILNIDRFIDINNFYSAYISDELLKIIAKLLVSITQKKKDITIFKLPVDEYAIYTNSEKISDFEFTNIIQAAIKLIEKKPFEVENNEIIVSITAGIALSCDDTYINADTALKIAKKKKKSMVIYNKEDNVEINFQNNIKWTKILKEAIKDHRIIVLKQPIINNSDAESKKYECLIRIQKEDGQYITPYHFLDIAKRIKLYPHLTKIVVAQSFKHFSKCTCKKQCEFSINLTLDDITNEDTVKYITQKLNKYKVGNQVIFEIVESEGIDNFEEVSLFIKTMKEYGCKFAIDDFGTGYSNFEYLMKLNVDFIKIDGSFIKNIDKNAQSQLISSLIIDFSKQQGISTIAEFVHSKEVLKKVKEMGIDYSQGFYLGEPEEL